MSAVVEQAVEDGRGAVADPVLLPPPQRCRITPSGSVPAGSTVRQILDPSLSARPPGAYRITVDDGGVRVHAAGAEGFFYARETLDQLASGGALPFAEIEDWPDHPVRGFYHDVTRGKVPTLQTLLALARRCADYKLNHLQLYIEHTFAFRCVPEVWEGADPLTADEILALDAHCAALHIDLVPSFSTFGHFHRFLRVPRLEHLNELDVRASAEPYCWRDTMTHYTLDPGNPESIELVRGILSEVAPLFRSRYFNVCADETFDLGRGKSAARAAAEGLGRVYVDFLKEILAHVRTLGRTPMFWGDIAGKYPELLGELGDDVIALDWDYTPELTESRADIFRAAGMKFYVCAGTGSWTGPLPAMHLAARNIAAFARRGLSAGASGFLLTDWGDYGHPSPLGLSFPGLLLGASEAWRVGGMPVEAMDEAVSRLEFGDPSGRLAGELRAAAAAVRAPWRMLAHWKQPRSRDFEDKDFDAATGLPVGALEIPYAGHLGALDELRARSAAIGEVLSAATPRDPLVAREILVALEGAVALESVFLCLLDRAGRRPEGHPQPDPDRAAEALAGYARGLEDVWHRRNKPSEFFRLREVLLAVVDDLVSGSTCARHQGAAEARDVTPSSVASPA